MLEYYDKYFDIRYLERNNEQEGNNDKENASFMKPYGKKEILDFLVDQYKEMTENGLDL